MRIKKYLALFTVVIGLSFIATPQAKAQVSLNFGVNVGPQPICPYGYYDYAPYNCAPYGYYGPQWFTNGIFIGAGPWFRGPRGWYGYVDRRFDPRYGYRGPFPHRGERDERFHGYGHGEFHGRDRMRGYGQGDHGDHGYHRGHGDHGHGH